MRTWTIKLWGRRDVAAMPERDLADVARDILAARRAAQAHLPIDLLHDPALDMLLTLVIARSEGIALGHSALATATTVGTATASRWLKAIAQHGLIEDDAGSFRLTEAGYAAASAAIKAVVAATSRSPKPASDMQRDHQLTH